MKENAQARLDALKADLVKAQAEYERIGGFMQAARGAIEVLEDLLKDEEGLVLG